MLGMLCAGHGTYLTGVLLENFQFQLDDFLNCVLLAFGNLFQIDLRGGIPDVHDLPPVWRLGLQGSSDPNQLLECPVDRGRLRQTILVVKVDLCNSPLDGFLDVAL